MNIPEKLAREISRVTEVIGFYEETIAKCKRGELPNLSPLTESVVLPLLKKQLEQAIKAAGANDPLEQMAAVATLEDIQ